MVPKKVFFTRGMGVHKEHLRSFESALRNAGIEKCNLVTVSSIIPPDCRIIPKSEGLKSIKPGQITFCVIARNASNEPSRLITASIGYAFPSSKDIHGYISEHTAFGESEEKAGEYAEELASKMLSTTLGEKHIGKKDMKTDNIAQSAVVGKEGDWTTVVSLAVFCF